MTDAIHRYCPKCGALDTHTEIANRGEPGPTPGDIAVCDACMDFHVYTEDGFRPMTAGESQRLADVTDFTKTSAFRSMSPGELNFLTGKNMNIANLVPVRPGAVELGRKSISEFIDRYIGDSSSAMALTARILATDGAQKLLAGMFDELQRPGVSPVQLVYAMAHAVTLVLTPLVSLADAGKERAHADDLLAVLKRNLYMLADQQVIFRKASLAEVHKFMESIADGLKSASKKSSK